MKKRKLAVWIRYDSEDGYVWPQVYATEKEAYLDERMNRPIKVMRLVSDPYTPKRLPTATGSFGTELFSEEDDHEYNYDQ